jgi:glutamate-5-semialdehyde dehydrogenase
MRNWLLSVTASTRSHSSSLNVENVLVVGDRDVVDENIDATEALHNRLDQRGDVAALGDIGGEQRGLAAGGLDDVYNARAARLVEVNDSDLGAPGGEQPGNLLADIAPGASHDRHLILELHCPSLLRVPTPIHLPFSAARRPGSGGPWTRSRNAQKMDYIMTAPLKTIESTTDIAGLMHDIGRRAKAAARVLALTDTAPKDDALAAMAAAIRARKADILAANAQDLAEAKASGATAAFLDRLALDDKRVAAMADGLDVVRALADPVGEVTERWTRPNGMTIERVRVPLGTVGIIYESRPNVTADAAALCLKAGDAAILRGGSESQRSNRAIHSALTEGLRAAGLPEAAVELVPTRDRAAVGMMLAGLDGAIDVIVPRGGKSLVGRVQAEARVPVFAHLEGICHVYVDKAARLDMAKTIALNAKMRRTGVCGAAETLLVDRAAAPTHLKPLITMLLDAGCEVRGDEAARAVDPRVKPASEEDWSTEYLDAVIATKIVDGVDAAIRHIERYGSHHTDSIVTDDGAAAEKFLHEVDSAIVLHNASTQFADGGEFGFGAEIGIATGRFHARGPVGVEQLTSFKYRVRGSGQIRP